MENPGFVAPVIALVLWTLVIWLWMYATRIPAMQKAKVDPQSAARARSLGESLPPEVMYVSDNYNHLMEQPTIFYAAALAAQTAGLADGLGVGLAWAYVILRIVHSLIQCTVNVVTARFAVFSLSTIVLGVLAIRVALAVF